MEIWRSRDGTFHPWPIGTMDGVSDGADELLEQVHRLTDANDYVGANVVMSELFDVLDPSALLEKSQSLRSRYGVAPGARCAARGVPEEMRWLTTMVYVVEVLVRTSDGATVCFTRIGSGNISRLEQYCEVQDGFMVRVIGFVINDLLTVGGGAVLIEHLCQVAQMDHFGSVRVLDTEFQSTLLADEGGGGKADDAELAKALVDMVARHTGHATAVATRLPRLGAFGSFEFAMARSRCWPPGPAESESR